MEHSWLVADLQVVRSVCGSYPLCISNIILDYLPAFHNYRAFCNTKRFKCFCSGPGASLCQFRWKKGGAVIRHLDFDFFFFLSHDAMWDFMATARDLPMIERMEAMPGANDVDASGPRVKRFGDLHILWDRLHFALVQEFFVFCFSQQKIRFWFTPKKDMRVFLPLPSPLVDLCEAFARAFDPKPRHSLLLQDCDTLLTIEKDVRLLFLKTDGTIHVQDGLGPHSSSFVRSPHLLDCLTNLDIHQEFHFFDLDKGLVAGHKGTFTRQENLQWTQARFNIDEPTKHLHDDLFIGYSGAWIYQQSCHYPLTHCRQTPNSESVSSIGTWNGYILAGLVNGNVAMFSPDSVVTICSNTPADGVPVHFVGALSEHRWLSASKTFICLWKGSELVALFANPVDNIIISALCTSDGQVILHAKNMATWLLNPFSKQQPFHYFGVFDDISSLPDGRILTFWRSWANTMEVSTYL